MSKILVLGWEKKVRGVVGGRGGGGVGGRDTELETQTFFLA